MTPFAGLDRCRPKGEHAGYTFRARKNVGGSEGKFKETKHRRRSHLHERWERAPAPREWKPTDKTSGW